MNTFYQAERPHALTYFMLVISVMIHLLVIYLLYTYQAHQQHATNIPSSDTFEARTTILNHLPPALIPGASLFGIPIQWTFNASDTPPLNDAQGVSNDQPKQEPAISTKDIPTTFNDNAPTVKQQSESAIEKEGKHDSLQQPTLPEVLPASAQNIVSDNNTSFVTDHQETPKKTKNMPIVPSAKTVGYQTHTRHDGVHTRKLTLADIANGFIDSIRAGGNDFAQRAGDRNKRPDEQELKKLQYLYSLVWAMQTEWRIKSHKMATFGNLSATVKIVVNRTGHLDYISLVESSGDKAYDSFVLKGIQRASPFQPMPSFIKTDAFDATIVFTNDARRESKTRLHSSSLLKQHRP